ncbi:MAG: baseplate J/gp47 family protein [Gammaproteobacteria bacterium]
MTITYPTLQQITDRNRADVRAALPEVDPTIRTTFIGAFVDSASAREFELYQVIMQLQAQVFPQTATGEFLERWADYDGLARLSAVGADGDITVSGTVTTSVPPATEFRTAGDVVLITQGSGVLKNIATSIASLTSVGTVATAVTSSDHNLASGVIATISGASEAEYNGSFSVTVLDNITFTFEVSGSPPADTGSPVVDFDGAVLSVETEGVGQSQNIGSGASATVTTPISGLDDSGFVRPEGIVGGTDTETDEELRSRTLEKRALFEALFNSGILVVEAKKVPGVTRVFVREITPQVGTVTVYFMRDNDSNPIPAAENVQDVKDQLDAIRPAHTDTADLIVLAPTPVLVNVSLSNIFPDTQTMRAAIPIVLAEFFSELVDFEQDITTIRLSSALLSSQDTETGDFLSAFSLDVPASDVAVSSGEIGVLGTVTII